VHAATGAPLRKVSLRLKRFQTEDGVRDTPSVSNYATTSDAEGKFVFEDVAPGTYWLSADRTGFLEQGYGARGPLLKGSPLKLTAGQRRDDVVMKLTPQSFLYGKVTDEDGDIMPNAQVLVYRAGTGRKQAPPVGSSTSQDDGSFVIGNLMPGRYYLSAAEGRRDDDQDPTDRKLTESYITTYYPSVSGVTGATAVEVTAGVEVRGLEIRLRRARIFRIRGKAVNTLTGGSGASVSLKLTALDESASAGRMEVGAVTGKDGLFEFEGVAPGRYAIAAGGAMMSFTMVGGADGFELKRPAPEPLMGRTVVQVADQNVDNLVLALGEGVEITGAIRMAGGDAARPSPWPSLVLASASPGADFAMPAQVKPDGTFHIQHIVPDGYSIQVNGLPDSVYVKSARFGGRDITGEDLSLTSGAGGVLEIELSPDAATLSGIVRGADGEGAAGATVQVCQDPDTVKFATADENGEYKIGGLPPGDYKLLAWEEVDQGLSTDAGFRSHFAAQSEAVKLTERGHSTVELKLIAREAIEAEAARVK